MPFIGLLLVATLGFALGTHLLLQHTIFGDDTNYNNLYQTIMTIWNAGFRFIPPQPEPMRSRWQITLFYVLFMVFVQVNAHPRPSCSQAHNPTPTSPTPDPRHAALRVFGSRVFYDRLAVEPFLSTCSVAMMANPS